MTKNVLSMAGMKKKKKGTNPQKSPKTKRKGREGW